MPPSFPSNSTNSQNGEMKLKIKLEIPHVVTLETSSSDEDEEPIRYLVFCFFHFYSFYFLFIYILCILFSKKRRIPVASKTSVQAVQEKDVRPMPERYSENCDNENGDSREKGKRRSVRRSAQEAAKKLKRNFAASYGDDDDE